MHLRVHYIHMHAHIHTYMYMLYKTCTDKHRFIEREMTEKKVLSPTLKYIIIINYYIIIKNIFLTCPFPSKVNLQLLIAGLSNSKTGDLAWSFTDRWNPVSWEAHGLESQIDRLLLYLGWWRHDDVVSVLGSMCCVNLVSVTSSRVVTNGINYRNLPTMNSTCSTLNIANFPQTAWIIWLEHLCNQTNQFALGELSTPL